MSEGLSVEELAAAILRLSAEERARLVALILAGPLTNLRAPRGAGYAGEVGGADPGWPGERG
jgi:hypothetical protein